MSDNFPRTFLIASHGAFSAGIRSALEMITGEQERLYVIEGYVNGNQSMEAEIREVIRMVEGGGELIVFTDLLGGSVTNQVIRVAAGSGAGSRVHVLAGMNLPLLIEIMMADGGTPLKETIAAAIAGAREQLVYVNQLLDAQQNVTEDD